MNLFTKSKNLIYLLVISVAFNVVAFLKVIGGEGNIGDEILATERQLSCLDRWYATSVVKKQKIYGPKYFEDYYLATVTTKLEGDGFELKYSSCFVDKEVVVQGVTGLDSAIKLLGQENNIRVGIIKSPDSDKTYIYTKYIDSNK